MATRIILGGRVLGTGKYGGQPLCLCGERVETLGRCLACHEALRRRRLGLKPANEAEAKRLRGYIQKFEAASSRCKECGATTQEEHREDCYFSTM